MSNDYSRRSNTDGYQVRIQSRINLAEDLLRAVRATSIGIDDLTERDRKVTEWLTGNRETVRLIYTDGRIIEGLPTTTHLDLGEISHQDILEELDAIVSGQINALRNLLEETRAWDGKAKVPA